MRFCVKILVFFILFLLLSSSNAFAQETNEFITLEKQYELSNENVKKIDNFVIEQMKLAKTPGISVVIVRDDKILFKNSYGYADNSNLVHFEPVVRKY